MTMLPTYVGDHYARLVEEMTALDAAYGDPAKKADLMMALGAVWARLKLLQRSVETAADAAGIEGYRPTTPT